MRTILRRMPSPSMVVACIALAVALGGTSYAAITLPRNSVGTKQLRPNSVSMSKIRKGAVTAPKLARKSVGPAKLQLNAVRGPNVRNETLTGSKIVESTLAKVPSAASSDTAANAATVAGNTVKRFAVSAAPGGAEATVLNLNGLVVTLTCPGGSVALRANNNSGEAAQLRFAGRGETVGNFDGGSASFQPTTNANLNNGEDLGSGSAHFVRANGTGVTAEYGWRDDALGTTTACRVFGVAISG